MGWIKYKYTGSFESGRVVHETPLIEVEISHNGKSQSFSGLIDSGCTMTHMAASIADFFNIDLTKCKEGISKSADGIETRVPISEISIKLKDFGDAFVTPVIFSKGLPVPILLGQNNFFDKFDVKFEKRNNTFEIKRNDMSKKAFLSLLGKAISSPITLQKAEKIGSSNGKQIRPRKLGGASGKRNGKSR